MAGSSMAGPLLTSPDCAPQSARDEIGGGTRTRPLAVKFLFSAILYAASFPKFDVPQSHLGKVPAGRMGRALYHILPAQDVGCRDVGANGVLSAKVDAVGFVAAQIGPEFLFNGSEFMAQFNGRPPPNLPRLRPASPAGRNRGRDKTRQPMAEIFFIFSHTPRCFLSQIRRSPVAFGEGARRADGAGSVSYSSCSRCWLP